MNNSETKYIDKLKSWAETVEMHPLPDWDELPELELYMDQVIILTGRYLGYMEPLTGEDKPVTPAMINNYVKMGLMPPPVKKKYSRCQLACIIIICILKRSLTMSAIQKILNKDMAPADIERLYRTFTENRSAALSYVTDQLRTRKDKNIADDEADGAVQTPRNFTLTFTRDGGRFTWDHIRDIASLAFYELRTDVYVGEETGLLERTVNNYSTAMPVTFVGHVYLYAFNQDGLYSNPAEILYNKPRPDAPTNISITTNADGTMVTFSEIPNNCIGAYIYIDNKRYTAYDNVFIITDDIKGVEQIKVSFFDQFGEGEQGILYLVLPDVTGLLVERNGPELDFYWDPINIYNVKYVVKVCSELSWERGTELFRTATNDKNRRLYPNRGDYYLMVKAYDEHGNYSKNAAYQFMTTETDISRNIILEFDQADTAYSGSKLNVYYDPVLSGVTLEADATYGEYIFNVELDQEYKARNWLEYNAFSVTDNNTWTWEDYTVAWQDANIHWAGVLGDVDSANIRQEIAYYKGVGTNNLFYAQLDGDLLTEDEESPLAGIEQTELFFFSNDGGENTKKAMELLKVYLSE